MGDRHLEAAVRNNYADLLRANGEQEAVMTELKLAIAIFSDIGQRADDWEPEIWKLAEWSGEQRSAPHPRQENLLFFRNDYPIDCICPHQVGC